MARSKLSTGFFGDLDENTWKNIVNSIETLRNIYQLGNLIISLGTIWILRRLILKFGHKANIILEIGVGPGTFIKLLNKIPNKIVLGVEPSPIMAYYSRRINQNIVIGVAEKLPFRDSSVDLIYCVFSFRDFFNKYLFIKEAFRVLRKNGRVVILDTNNPNSLSSRIFHRFIEVAGKILSFLFRKKNNLYVGLRKSIELMKNVEHYSELFKKIGFRYVCYRKYLMGNAFILVALK